MRSVARVLLEHAEVRRVAALEFARRRRPARLGGRVAVLANKVPASQRLPKTQERSTIAHFTPPK